MPESEDPKNEVLKPGESHPHHHNHYGWRSPWVILAGVALVAVIVMGTAVHRATVVGFGPKTMMFQGQMGPGGFGQRMMAPNKFGGNPNESQLQGVVTSVNGTTITVAGYGATNTIQTSASTQYQNATSAKVNDTVMVSGTISNGTFNVTRVVVNP